jgi:hypothetical protein
MATPLLAPLLCALVFVPQTSKPADFAKELAALRAEYQKARAEYTKPFSEAKTPEERMKVKLDPEKNPAKDFVGKFADLAKRAKGTEPGLQATMEQMRATITTSSGAMALSSGGARQSNPELEKLIDETITNYIEAPYLAQFVPYLGMGLSPEKADALRERVIEKSPHAAVRGEARFAIAYALYTKAGDDEIQRKEAYKMMELVVKEIPETSSGRRAAGVLYERDHLQIGMVAPDFTAKDQDGKEFKLSDYRGKVVMLDFWGFW